MTADTRTIYERMVAVMADVPAIEKTGFNKEQGFRFRGIEQVMGALQAVLVKHGVFVVPRVLSKRTEQRATAKGGSMNVTHLDVEFTFFGLAGDSVVAVAPGEAQDSADKSTNKAMSAAMKYALTQTFCIPTADLDDADRHHEDASGPPPSVEDGLRSQIKGLGERLNLTTAALGDDFAALFHTGILVANEQQLRDYIERLELRASLPQPEPDAPAVAAVPDVPSASPEEAWDIYANAKAGKVKVATALTKAKQKRLLDEPVMDGVRLEDALNALTPTDHGLAVAE